MSSTHPAVSLPGTEMRSFRSAHVDQEYRLFIALPQGYASSERSYPVIYLTDANTLFGTSTLVAGLLSRRSQPVVVVGVGYPVNSMAKIFPLRARDFTPTKNEKDEHKYSETYRMPLDSGGGEEFFALLRDDLIPFISREYRVTDDRTLFGYSFGGTFALFTMFNHTDCFSRYIIGAPDLGWDNELCFRYEQQYADTHEDLPVKLYLGVGTLDEAVAVDRNVSTLFRFHALLKSRNYAGLTMDFEVFEGETHAFGMLPALSRGLRAVFG